MRSRSNRLLLLTLLAATGISSARPARAASEADCFDAEVSATIVRQTPTVMPESDDLIIMRWPWIVDLEVHRVRRGSARRGLLTVLTVQHTDYRDDLGRRRWLLRRNTLGSFNAVAQLDDRTLPACSTGAPPATPFIRPAGGRTLDDLRRESEEHYGRD